MTLDIQTAIELAWENRAELSPKEADAASREAVESVIDGLDTGRLRVAEKINNEWVVHQWIKKAVLLSFRLNDNAVMGQAPLQYFDKVPLKFADYHATGFQAGGYRVVPPAVARRGAFIGRNVVLMPSYVNIGARSEVVEGVIVEENSVLAMGVFLSQSTRIYDRETGKVHFGRVPSGSVVVPGSLPAADGSHSLACAVIVKRVDAQTRAKTSINDLLRA